MQPLDLLSAGGGLTLSIALLVLRGQMSPLIWVCYGILLLILSFGILFQQAHWQLSPIYLAVLLVPLLAWEPSGIRLLIAGALTLLLISSAVALCFLLPMFRLPESTGPYPVGTRILHMVDKNRPDSGGKMASGRRELMVQAWYPIDRDQAHGRFAPYRRGAESSLLSSYMAVLKTQSYLDKPIARKEENYPIILFNPAWKGQRTQSTYLMQELASHGFVVISIDHTYLSGPVAFPDGTVVRSSEVQDIDDFKGRSLTAQQQQGEAEVMLEAADDSFVLDELTRRQAIKTDSWYERMRLSRVGTMGHSFGGAVACQVAFSDNRVASALNMDGWIFGDPQRNGFRTPTMEIDEEATIPTEAALHDAAQEEQLYWRLTRNLAKIVTSSLRDSGGYQLTIAGSRHMNFADRSLYSPIRKWTDAGVTDRRQVHKIISVYALAFFEETLLNEPQPLLRSPTSPFPETTFMRYATSKFTTAVRK